MKKVLTLLVFCVVILASCSDETTEEPADVPDADEQEERVTEEGDTDAIDEPRGEVYHFSGQSLVTDDFTIEITDHAVLQPGEGNNHSDEPILGFWFDVTVDEEATEAEINPNTAWIMSFEAVQDNDPNAVNELDVGVLPDEEHLDSQMQTIKPGGTVSSSISYELTDDETPVTLTAIENIVTGEALGSHDFPIE
jgi:hypothetical protein